MAYFLNNFLNYIKNKGDLMQWGLKDMEKIKQSLEYIDTAVLPLLPVSFREEMGQAGVMTEFISLLALRLERMYRGRILLLPGFSYLKERDAQSLFNEIRQWEEELIREGFKHVFFLTSDPVWRMREKELTGSIIWIPALALQKFNETEQRSILEDQAKQLSPLFLEKWQ